MENVTKELPCYWQMWDVQALRPTSQTAVPLESLIIHNVTAEFTLELDVCWNIIHKPQAKI